MVTRKLLAEELAVVEQDACHLKVRQPSGLTFQLSQNKTTYLGKVGNHHKINSWTLSNYKYDHIPTEG